MASAKRETMKAAPGRRLVILELDSDTAVQLEELGYSDAVSGSLADVLKHAACSLADGVRRPGSWERSIVERMYGQWEAANARRAGIVDPKPGPKVRP